VLAGLDEMADYVSTGLAQAPLPDRPWGET
jgi:hypothetical protein